MATASELLPRLRRKLGIQAADTDSDLMLIDALEDAIGETRAYLCREDLPSCINGHLVRLAALFYQQDVQAMDGNPGVKAWEYSEGEQSQKHTCMTPDEYQSSIQSILASLSRYRLVRVKGGAEDEAE